ncbi:MULTISPECIES: hypothetical protein [unclassified Bradyrhizobium]|uniref:hypothetical protein n=1 Tax=unclassified Bradyrhizobium TaxID=2631580 RepID=UPI002915E08C|nr:MULTISPECIES: hypothetical protein [unclassified Bradyrhizobium]
MKPSLLARLLGAGRRFVAMIRHALLATGSFVLLVLAAILRPIGYREIILFAGLGLISVGVAPIYPPAAWIVPGAILAGVAIFGVRA